VNELTILDSLPPYLPPNWSPNPSPIVDHLYSLRVGTVGKQNGVRHLNLLYADTIRVARTRTLAPLLSALESWLHFSVAVAAPRFLFVHAGVVEWHGHAIVIPGRSGTGKTSLVFALLQAGANYYSDEYAVLDEHGRVHPYPKPLSIRDSTRTASTRFSPESPSRAAGTGPLPVGCVLVSPYVSGADWIPRSISSGQAVLALLDNTLLARLRPQRALSTLHRSVTGAVTLRSNRGEACDVALPLLNLLSGSSSR